MNDTRTPPQQGRVYSDFEAFSELAFGFTTNIFKIKLLFWQNNRSATYEEHHSRSRLAANANQGTGRMVLAEVPDGC